MILNASALVCCLVLLSVTQTALVRAVKNGDRRQVRVLQLLRLGLGFSACAYLLRLPTPVSEPAQLVSLVASFAGALLIWIGWMEQWSLLQQRRRSPSAAPEAEPDDGAALAPPVAAGAGLPCLNSRAQRVLCHARQEAQRRRQCGVDTDHVLLGLLQEPSGAGRDILKRLNIKQENIRLALGQAPEPDEQGGEPPAALPLTDRARRALALAAQEAHRFEKTSVGTDHLLLGLVLMGTGAAAVALFREGVTVEGVRNAILQSRARG